MSNQEAPEEHTNDSYVSNIDSAFSEAWNEVYSEEAGSESPETGAEGSDPGAGAVPGTPGVESGGQAAATPEPGAGGSSAAIPNAGDLPGVQAAGEDATNPGQAGSPGSPGGDAGGTGGSGTGSLDFATVTPLFDAAITGLNERAEQQFRSKAVMDIRDEIDPKFLEAIDQHPRLLVGETVPNVKGGGTEIIRDQQDAKDWQEAVRSIITKQVNQKTQEYLTEAKPFLSSLQDSVEMFRRNPDLVPGTATFNRELANRFTALAKSYEYRVDDKLVGYRVDVQPLIEAVRQQVAAAPAAPAAPTPRQTQAAQQPRNDSGQFEAPQAGIPSTQAHGGSEEEDYSAFWGTLGMKDMAI